MRSKQPTHLRWWQVRPIDFALFLFPLIVQRALVLPISIVAMTYADEGMPLSRALDMSYIGMNGPKSLLKIIVLGWVLLVIATATSFVDKCYPWQKSAIVFLSLAVLMTALSLNILNLFEPYLAVL